MRNHLIIFDCDGVLVDSETLSARVLQVMALELGLAFTHGEALSLIRGRKVAEWVAEIEEAIGRTVGPDFVPEFRNRASRAFIESLSAVPYVEQALQDLDLPFCTASSAPLDKINQTLGLTGLRPYFENRMYSAYEIGIWKPDPGLFLHAARNMNVLPENCAVVEDSLVGVQAGIAAGMTVFGYAPGDTAEMLTEAGATVFQSMTELPGLIDRWRLDLASLPDAYVR